MLIQFGEFTLNCGVVVPKKLDDFFELTSFFLHGVAFNTGLRPFRRRHLNGLNRRSALSTTMLTSQYAEKLL